ncbi:MAG: hypothetical protein ACKOQW_01445 [Phycisphaerales bacterium]
MQHGGRLIMQVAGTAIVALACASSVHAQARPPLQLTVPKVRAAPTPREEPAPEMWVTFGPGGEVRVLPADAAPSGAWDALSIDAPGRIRPRREGVLVMADGQRIVGELESGIGAPTWSTSWRTPMALSLDGMRALVLQGVEPPPAGDVDRVYLRNGDEATGIVTALTESGVELELGAGAERSTRVIPFDAVRAASCGAPPAERSGVRTWLEDGSVVDGTSIAWTPEGTMTLAVPGIDPVELPDGSLVAAQRAPGAVVALASLAPTATEPEEGRGMRLSVPAPTPAPGTWALDAPPIEIEGPVSLAYPSAGGVRRLVATAIRPRRASAAGVVDLVIRTGTSELLRHRFTPGDLRLDVRVDLPDGPFEILLLPADGSFVGDVVVLERALLLAR